MRNLMLTLVGLASVAGCSDRRDRPAPATADLTLPAEVSRTDSSSEAGSPVKQRSADTAKPTPGPTPKRRKSTPGPSEVASTQGYAPAAHSNSASTDSATGTASDTAVLSTTETTPTATESTPPVPAESASGSRRDTVAPDVVARDSTSPVDTMSGHDTAPTATMPAASSVTRTLPTGTEIRAALNDSINSRYDSVGRMVTAHVMDDIVAPDGGTVIAAGAPVRLTITKLGPAKSKSASAGTLGLKVEGIAIGGELQQVPASVRPVPHELRGRGVTAGDAAKVGVGAAGGAVLGRVITGNSKGTVIGGVVGAAGGAVVASQTASRDVVVQPRTPVTLVLTQPLVVSPSHP